MDINLIWLVGMFLGQIGVLMLLDIIVGNKGWKESIPIMVFALILTTVMVGGTIG